MSIDLVCEVRLWGQRVGALIEEQGQVIFEYDAAFLGSGLEISPFELPLRPGVFTRNDRSEAFQGLQGIFADSLPDKFGNAIIERYFRTTADTARHRLSVLQKLLYIGSRSMGALEYLPPIGDIRPRTRESLEIARLVQEARQVIEGELEVASAEIMQVGVSAGGQYPKAVIAWNPQTNHVVSGLRDCPQGYRQWIIKFDGTQGEPQPFGKLEYAYAQMARDAGIRMAETHLLAENGRHHFMVRRFDRTDTGQRLHMASLCGLLQKDFNIPRLLDYEDYLRVTQALAAPSADREQAFRRMVFNVIARNQDDHTKNFSFLMDTRGRWQLSPAYDLTFACGQRFTASHQMTVNGKDRDIRREDLAALGEKFAIPDYPGVIDQVIEVVRAWPDYAAQASMPTAFSREIGELHQTSL
ncbi:MAG: type II toxin-antitoxin system HipA family toxin [Gammaproteobacteria bacterium]|nr:type II toxin-antitoxin system HipA family toxin [Gammaproteobacteria bacterium]